MEISPRTNLKQNQIRTGIVKLFNNGYAVLVGVLSACSHTGLLDRGTEYFYSMKKDYGVTRTSKHYTCMIDLHNRLSKTAPHENKSRNKVLRENLVRYLMSQEEWKRSGGRDHLILAHHPNSMLDARMKLWPATFILSDFGRYPPNIANVEKDVIAPYKHVVGSYVDDQSSFDSRKTLLYFQGAIYRKNLKGR